MGDVIRVRPLHPTVSDHRQLPYPYVTVEHQGRTAEQVRRLSERQEAGQSLAGGAGHLADREEIASSRRSSVPVAWGTRSGVPALGGGMVEVLVMTARTLAKGFPPGLAGGLASQEAHSPARRSTLLPRSALYCVLAAPSLGSECRQPGMSRPLGLAM
jgi:hypothetical protein